MKLSIVIVNWNTRDLLLAALRSIASSSAPFEIETIVVDNASTDGSADAVRDHFPTAMLIASDSNHGYALGNNLGLRQATGDWLLLLNPDVELAPDSLRLALDAAQAIPKLGALSVTLVTPKGNVQPSVRGFPYPSSLFFEVCGLSRLAPNSHKLAAYRMPWFDYSRQADVDQPMGTFLLIPAVALQQVGLLDEQFPIFFNDVDWCYRAKLAGLRIVYSPVTRVLHHGGSSTSLVAPRMAWESRNSLLCYVRKHFRYLLYTPLYWLIAAASAAQAARVAHKRLRLAKR